MFRTPFKVIWNFFPLRYLDQNSRNLIASLWDEAGDLGAAGSGPKKISEDGTEVSEHF
jgi:hypothetical protein